MPARASTSSREPAAVAPDGIAIHAFDVPGAAHVGVAEGRIPPGRYGIHRHLSLEQFTYVLSGNLIAITGNPEHPDGRETALAPGSLLLTLPGETLQFLNASDDEARVLFICAPPYPPDDSDTRTLASHGLPDAPTAAAAIERLTVIRDAFNRAIDKRIAQMSRSAHHGG